MTYSVLGRIKIPAEAVVPLLIGVGCLLVLLFAGSTLVSWKERNPKGASIFGLIIGAVCYGFAIYTLGKVFTEEFENDAVHQGVQVVTMFDGPIAGFLAIVGTLMWKFGNQKWPAAGLGGLIGVALIAKPFVYPLAHRFESEVYKRDMMDLEHIAFYGPGIVVAVVALIVALSLSQPATASPNR